MNKKIIMLISFLVFILDIISKMVVSHFLSFKESIKIIDNFLYLTYVRNEGVAFSFLDGSRLFIILMSLIVFIIIFYYLKRNEVNLLDGIGFGLVIGGAFGNFIDRVIYGYVIDFIDVYIFGYDYPIFNIADIGVVIGVMIIFISGFMKGRKSDKNGSNSG